MSLIRDLISNHYALQHITKEYNPEKIQELKSKMRNLVPKGYSQEFLKKLKKVDYENIPSSLKKRHWRL